LQSKSLLKRRAKLYTESQPKSDSLVLELKRSAPSGQTPLAAGRSTARLVTVIAVIAVAAVGGYYGYGYVSRLAQPTWPFKGAYAEYGANGTALLFPYQVSIRLEVVDLNSTATQFLTTYKFTLAGQTHQNSSTRWVKSASGATTSPFTPTMTPGRVYNTTVSISGKTFDVTAYEYGAQAAVTTIYVSKQVPLPVQFKFTAGTPPALFTISINLIGTNVPQLSS
jgi:hypothetical protein